MSKLKGGKCPSCGLPVRRHDPVRMTVEVGKGANGEGVHKQAHLACAQAMEELAEAQRLMGVI